MSIRLSTAGITLNYAVESAAGARPTANYTKVPEIKSIPEMNPEPDTIDTTTLEETEYKTYIDGLKDLGGALSFTANLTKDLVTAWETAVEAAKTAADGGKATWWCVLIPGLEKALYFPGTPSALGMPGAEVGDVLEATLYITPTGAPIWSAKPTGE